jgi:two-component system phosphate regulon sensor histidine kinase PhoR
MVQGLVAGSEDHKRGFQRIVYLLTSLVIVPTGLLAAVGILMMVLDRPRVHVLLGILVMMLVVCLVTGAVLSLVFVGREAKLSKLQLDFVSKVSHELRTPLTSIRMFAEMLQNGASREPGEQALCLEVLHRETIRLSERIERLLDWGRMEAGRWVYERQPDQVDVVVREAVAAFTAAHVGRAQTVDVELAPGLPPVLVDRGALVDALVNLLSNAVKYSDPDKHVAVRASADARHVRIAVVDDGIGIPRGEHKRIFQKFYRVDDRLSRAVEGSGLGLAIVRHIALGHGGRVEVDSTPGRGSTFTIVLPRPSPAEIEALAVRRAAEARRPNRPEAAA